MILKWLIGLPCLLLVLVLVLVACDTGGGSDASDEDLTGALLTVEDMPSRWSIDEEGSSDTTQVCNAPPLGELIDPDAEAERRFTTGETGPLLTQHLVALEYEDDAMNGIDRIREAFDCGEWTDSETDTTWTIAETAFPELGDETAAYRFSTTGTDNDISTNGNAIVIRDGGVILLVVHVAPGEIDASVTEEITRTAFDKAEDV